MSNTTQFSIPTDGKIKEEKIKEEQIKEEFLEYYEEVDMFECDKQTKEEVEETIKEEIKEDYKENNNTLEDNIDTAVQTRSLGLAGKYNKYTCKTVGNHEKL